MADDSEEYADSEACTAPAQLQGKLGHYAEKTRVGKMCPPVDASDQYNLDHPRRGVAIIMCNEQFQDHNPRSGARLDVEYFQRTFQRLGVTDIRVEYNLGVVKMRQWFSRVSKEDHSTSDCLLVAVTSHGDEVTSWDRSRHNVKTTEDVIHATDGCVFTKELVEYFTDERCPSLAGKPKIFILQACRGTKLDQGITLSIQSDADMGEDVADAMVEPEYTTTPVPCYKDFLIVYATPPGYYAFRRPTEGSWFVKALWEVVERAGPGSIDFQRLLTGVIRRVAYDYTSHSTMLKIHDKKQTGCIYSMLTKDLYFTPKQKHKAMIH